MKKYGWKLIVLMSLASLVLIWLVRAPLLSSYLTNKMGIGVSMKWIGLWPSQTNIHLFSIKNPPEFKGSAFKANQVICDYSLGNLFGDPTIIDQIEIQDSTITIDFTNPIGTSNNWKVLGQKMRPTKRSHVVIRKLILTNFNVAISGTNLLAQAKQTHFDRLEFDDIDSQEGFPTAQLIRMIFQSGGIEQYIQDFFNPPANIQRVLNPLQMFGA